MLSVIIPTLNDSDKLYYTLSSLFSSNFPQDLFEAIIIVQNSSDNNMLELARKFPLRIISCPRNENAAATRLSVRKAAARNLGVRNAEGEIVCFTEPGVIVPEDWLRKTSEFFGKHPNIDGVGGPILSFNPRNRIQKFAGEIFLVDSGFPVKMTAVQPYKMEGSLFTHNCAFRKESFIATGGFDESFLGWQDIELSWRFAAKGRLLIFNPSIKVFYIFPSTLSAFINQYFNWGFGGPKLWRKYHKHSNGGLKAKLFPYYSLLTSFLHVLFPINLRLNDNILGFIRLTSWNLGRIYGYR